MLKEALSFYENIQINNSLISKIFSLDSERLEVVSDEEISKYSLCLAQYLVYFKYQFNKALAEQAKIKRDIDYVIFQVLTEDIIKKYKTKTDARQHLIDNTPELFKMRETLKDIEYELILAEGMDKSVLEMVNVFKKELTRREYELGAARYERKTR